MALLHALRGTIFRYFSQPERGSQMERVEDRKTTRRTMRMRDGFIWWPSRPAYPPQSCGIKDLSISGASIQFASPQDESLLSTPMRIQLVVEKQEYSCRMVWRKGPLIGIAFDGGPQGPTRTF